MKYVRLKEINFFLFRCNVMASKPSTVDELLAEVADQQAVIGLSDEDVWEVPDRTDTDFSYSTDLVRRDWEDSVVRDRASGGDVQEEEGGETAGDFRSPPGSPDSDTELPASPLVSNTRRSGSVMHRILKRKNYPDKTMRTLNFSPRSDSMSPPHKKRPKTPSSEPAQASSSCISPEKSKETAIAGEGGQTSPDMKSPSVPPGWTTPQLDISCSPADRGLKMAVSLGCDLTLPWQSQMKTPGGATPSPSSEELNTAERRELLPSSDVNLATPATPANTDKERTLTRKTLFTAEEITRNSQGIHIIRRSDLREVDCDFEDEFEANTRRERISASKATNINPRAGQTPGKGQLGLRSSRRVPRGVRPSPAHLSNNRISTGFQTAGGGQVEVMKESMLKVQTNFDFAKTEEVELKVAYSESLKPVGASLKEPKETFNLTSDQEKKSLRYPAPEPEAKDGSCSGEGLMLTGFSTAGGNRIEVSEKVVREVKMKFTKDLDEGSKPPAGGIVGFSTARGKKIEISEESLRKTKRMFEETSNQAPPSKKFAGLHTTGFSTGSGKKIQVSEESLRLTKKKFDNTSNFDAASLQTTGFSTGSGKKIQVSEESLKASREKFNNPLGISETAGTYSGLQATGFSTGSGKKIQVSEESLKVSREKFNNPSGISETAGTHSALQTTGFSTSSGKIIQVSEESLKASREKFNNPAGGSADVETIVEEVSEIQPVEENSSQWGEEDDEFLVEAANLADPTVVRDQEQEPSFKCLPYELSATEAPYKSHPDDFHSNKENTSETFNVPFAKQEKKPKAELDVDINFSIRNKTEAVEADSLSTSRQEARLRQQRLITSKAKKKIQPLPGKLIKIRQQSTARLSLRSQSIISNSSCTRRLNWAEASSFQFTGLDYFSEDTVKNNVAGVSLSDGMVIILDDGGNIGVEEVEAGFLAAPGVDPSLLPAGWVGQHYSWLVWTLHSYERRLDQNHLLSPEKLMARLKYRYDREIDRGERSIIRQILEHDEAAGVAMVLCVVAVMEDRLVVSDGWYHLPSPLYPGSALQRLVARGKIISGTKLVTAGAELIGSQAGKPCHPLEAEADQGRELRLHVNSTRRAASWLKLGRLRGGSVTLKMRSLVTGGGSVASLSVQVVRLYPLLYFIKEQGRSKWLSERDFEKLQRRTGSGEGDLYEQVQKELMDQEMKGRPEKVSVKDLKNISDGEELYNILRHNDDPLLLR